MNSSKFYSRAVGVLLVLATGLATTPALAKTLYVETWGSNSPTCGTRTNPCQYIGSTIGFRATPNDRIVVGPGHYTTNLFIGSNILGQPLTGLRIESSHGRYATTIESANGDLDTVRILVSGVRFGRKNKGFTITGATTGGRWGIEVADTGLENIRIEGNRITRNDRGVRPSGDRTEVRHNIIDRNDVHAIECEHCTRTRIRDNELVENGFSAIRLVDSNDVTIERNLMRSNGTYGVRSVQNVTEVTVRNNVITLSGEDGMLMSNVDDFLIQGNIVAGSDDYGLDLDQSSNSASLRLRNNLIVDNRNRIADVTDARVEGNTFADTDWFNSPALEIFNTSTFNRFSRNATYGSRGGCGLENNANTAISYSRHYFGGAGVVDDANDNDGIDTVCGSESATGTYSSRAPSLRAGRASRL